MPPALIAAGIGAAASIGGGLLGASASKKAANTAAAAQRYNTDQNNALARDFRSSNEANFQPNLQSGFRANSLIDSFLYGMPQQQPQPAAAFQPASQPGGAMTQLQQGGYSIGDSLNGFTATNAMGARNLGVMQGQQPPQSPPMQAPAQPGAAPTMGGYDAFVASPYYQNPLAEGRRGMDHSLAASGMLESGDAIKRGIRYGTDYAAGRQDEFLGLAGQQANRGVQGAGAIAGVGMNALNAMTSNNQNAADAASNAALLRGQANQQLYSGIGTALGGLAGAAFGGSSYGQPGIQMQGLSLPKGW